MLWHREHETTEAAVELNEPVYVVKVPDPKVLRRGRTFFERIRDEWQSKKISLLWPFNSRTEYEVFTFIHKARLTREVNDKLLCMNCVSILVLLTKM